MEFDHTNLPIETDYPKLVRDNIPKIIKKNEGIAIKTIILDSDAEFLEYLLKKFIEEATELIHSKNTEDIMKEMADIFELTDTILKLKGKTLKDVSAVQNEKRKKNGGFEKRILMLGK